MYIMEQSFAYFQWLCEGTQHSGTSYNRLSRASQILPLVPCVFSRQSLAIITEVEAQLLQNHIWIRVSITERSDENVLYLHCASFI